MKLLLIKITGYTPVHSAVRNLCIYVYSCFYSLRITYFILTWSCFSTYVIRKYFYIIVFCIPVECRDESRGQFY